MIKLSDYLHIPGMGRVLEDAEREKPAKAKRSFAAAKITRQNKDWTATTYGANWTLYRDLRILRARAREMAKNAPHFRKFLGMAERNVVGDKGIQLQCNATLGTNKTKRPDTPLNSRVESAFWEWAFKENCSVSGKLSFAAAQKLFLRQLIRDGETLVQHIAADNPFGYALKFWNVDWLDETYNEELTNGNRIIMSVEVDGNYKPLAYWLTTPASEINFTNRRARTRTRVPAEQMTHAFLVDEDESQTRGITWFHAALLQGKDLHEYTGGVVQSARVQSHVFGFIEDELADEIEFTGEEDDEGKQRPLEIDVSPLSINQLNPGQKFTQIDPKQPTQNHSEFKKSMLLDIASALGVMGFSLAGDMSAVNYSSARVGLGEERDVWRDLQCVVGEFCREVYHRWMRSSMITGKLILSAREFEQLQNPDWKPRGWRYVDPQKEVKANLDAIAGNLATFKSVLGEQGIDLEEFLLEKQQEKALFEQYGIDYGPPAPAAKPADNTDNADGKGKPSDSADRGYSNGKYHETDIVN
jgi:lambda family phage portal protein